MKIEQKTLVKFKAL